MESDGFQLVTSKKKSNKKANTSFLNITNSGPKSFNVQDVQELETKILDCKQKLQRNDSHCYWPKLLIEFHRIMAQLVQDYEIRGEQKPFRVALVCYGLGSVDENLSSRYQFALLLLLIDELRQLSGSKQRCVELKAVELFDPVFSPLDIHCFKNVYQLDVAASNDQCFRSVDSDVALTLFYMPHCGKALYNNLLYSNWSWRSLGQLMILGNSFSTIQLNTLDSIMQTYYPYIKDSLNLLSETSLDFECEFTNAFTDLCFIRTQPKANPSSQSLLNRLDEHNQAEILRQKPIYEPTEEIF